jgi:hypothetical protein
MGIGTVVTLAILLVFALATPVQAKDDVIIEEMTIEEGAIDASNTATGGNATGGSVGAIDNSSGATATGTGGEGGAGGSLKINYPDPPVASPAVALGGVCSTSISLTTKDVGLSLGTSDPLCRQMELVKMALFLDLKEEAETHYRDAVAMEKRGNWFARCKWTGWVRGVPLIGKLFQ